MWQCRRRTATAEVRRLVADPALPLEHQIQPPRKERALCGVTAEKSLWPVPPIRPWRPGWVPAAPDLRARVRHPARRPCIRPPTLFSLYAEAFWLPTRRGVARLGNVARGHHSRPGRRFQRLLHRAVILAWRCVTRGLLVVAYAWSGAA
jgi:hypothetical protein